MCYVFSSKVGTFGLVKTCWRGEINTIWILNNDSMDSKLRTNKNKSLSISIVLKGIRKVQILNIKSNSTQSLSVSHAHQTDNVLHERWNHQLAVTHRRDGRHTRSSAHVRHTNTRYCQQCAHASAGENICDFTACFSTPWCLQGLTSSSVNTRWSQNDLSGSTQCQIELQLSVILII